MDLEKTKEILKDEVEESSDYKDAMAVFELELLEESTGIIRGEFIEEGVKQASGSLVIPLNEDRPEMWQGMEKGEKKSYGFLLNSKKATWSEKLGEFFDRSITEGKIQDFAP